MAETTNGFSLGWPKKTSSPPSYLDDDIWRGGWKSSGSWWDCEPHVHTTGMAQKKIKILTCTEIFSGCFAWKIMSTFQGKWWATNLGYSCFFPNLEEFFPTWSSCSVGIGGREGENLQIFLAVDWIPVVAGEYPKRFQMFVLNGSIFPTQPKKYSLPSATTRKSHKSYTISLILLEIAWMFQKLGFVRVWQVILWRVDDI